MCSGRVVSLVYVEVIITNSIRWIKHIKVKKCVTDVCSLASQGFFLFPLVVYYLSRSLSETHTPDTPGMRYEA